MRLTAKKVVLGVAALLVVLVLAAITMVGWEVVLGPKMRETSSAPFEVTEARLARGRYLVEGPLHCFLCHAEHDFSQPEYPIVQAKKGAGWVMPIPELNNIPARNITPDRETGLGDWTDDEIARAIREGVRKDGTALFPVMPYLDFARMDDEDVKSIVVYLRTLTPVRNVLPARSLPGPLEWIVNTIPEPITTPQPSHPSATAEERGEYLANLAGCVGCHTPQREGQPVAELAFGGGMSFEDPGQGGKKVFSANISPDASGISHYTEDVLRETLRTGRIGGRVLSHLMPFEFLKNMTDEDISDVYAFLRSRNPVRHRLNNIDPPTMCVVCNQSHGLGDTNVAPAPSR